MNGNLQLLSNIRGELQKVPSPVIVFNKSHSGSRLLAQLLEAAGVFLGAHQNESRDSEDMLQLVEYLVGRYYPQYGPLWDDAAPVDAYLAAMLPKVFASHLDGCPSGARWGWKLCETAYILPVLDFLFPQARYIHLVRDGRDVAFCDHTPANTPFWRKIYFNTDRIVSWQGHNLRQREYSRHSHLFNAIHWVNSVTIGRAYGAMLRERYLEVRYEDLCRNFDATARQVLVFLQTPQADEAVERVRCEVRTVSVGKHLRQPKAKMRAVLELEKPLLLAMGYLDEDPFPTGKARLRKQLAKLLPWGKSLPRKAA